MDISADLSTILGTAGAITAIGGAWLTLRKIQKDTRKERDLEAARIIHTAKEEIAKAKVDVFNSREIAKREIDARLEALEVDLKNHKDSVDKDLQHIRETYNGEIRNLGQKIEDLRSELRNQHGQLVQLLTKMIGDRD